MGYQALILREPARAAATVQEFDRLGITSWCAQLIETIWPEDTAQLERLTENLARGGSGWLLLTSVTTVNVLREVLSGRSLPGSLNVAAVGSKTAQAAYEQLGTAVDFQPRQQSAAGMVHEWKPEPGSHIWYPHGDLASSTLSDFLRLLPVNLSEVIAYRTVDAGTPGRPVGTGNIPQGLQLLDPGQIGAKLKELDLVVFSAPSIVRRFRQLMDGTLPAQVNTLAIGEPTARALSTAGLPVSITARSPGPDGLAQAARTVLGIG
ncbi:uroporphyrinogen-III synthase [Glutamicibacter sp. NPDC087344]|uniref:uroporphyrinogen-III synthase n=1 Tax=Glutamicibacter sp. NPDC087344 TaxID=3363994 RepID=UPI00380C2A57